jgi:HAD superfamily hydrolase (TIGR01493 family)
VGTHGRPVSFVITRVKIAVRGAQLVSGVMFDFSGTLLRVESTEQWLRGALEGSDHVLNDSEIAACAQRLEALGALPGGATPRDVPGHLSRLWRERDLTAEHHRACYTALAREARLPVPELADALYERSCRPMAWQPYPDTESTLRELQHRRIPVAVVSNIGWDLRTVFHFHDLARYIDVFVLSYELGVKKPDPRIFQAACDELGLPPAAVLMVGDDRDADTGAATLGCPVHLVDHLPVNARPDSLTRVLDLI